MNESESWRRYVSVWIGVICVTALICCWLARPMRYQQRGPNAFDMRTGKKIRPTPAPSPQPQTTQGTKIAWDDVVKIDEPQPPQPAPNTPTTKWWENFPLVKPDPAAPKQEPEPKWFSEKSR